MTTEAWALVFLLVWGLLLCVVGYLRGDRI